MTDARAIPWCAAVALALLLAGCPSRDDRRTGTSTGASGTSGAGVQPGPTPLGVASRPAVLGAEVVGSEEGGLALVARALRTHLAPGDTLGLALRLKSDPSAGPASGATIDWGQVLPSLRVEVKTPAGASHTLELPDSAPSPPAAWGVRDFVQPLFVDGGGLTQRGPSRPWKSPVPDLLAAPGVYQVHVAATFMVNGRAHALRAGPLALEMSAAGGSQKPLVDLERAASEAARAAWSTKAIPLPVDPTIEHADGSFSVRFKRVPSSGETEYSDDVLEVWLDPAGRTLALDGYRHFNCVAEGTAVATEGGPVPIETLEVGSRVQALDPETGTRSIAVVESIARGHAESVRRIGALRVTDAHPVWANGRWTRAGDLAATDRLVQLDGDPLHAGTSTAEGPSTVYDLTVSAPHTFFAGGVLVHNKAAHVPLGPGPWGSLFHRHAAKP